MTHSNVYADIVEIEIERQTGRVENEHVQSCSLDKRQAATQVGVGGDSDKTVTSRIPNPRPPLGHCPPGRLAVTGQAAEPDRQINTKALNGRSQQEDPTQQPHHSPHSETRRLRRPIDAAMSAFRDRQAPARL